MPNTGKYITNFKSAYIIYIVRLLVGMFAFPIFLFEYGTELYGLFLVSFGLSNSIAVFDFGSSKSAFRYTVEFDKDKDVSKFSQAFNNSLTFNMLSALVIFFIMLGLGIFSSVFFTISPEISEYSFPLFTFSAINALVLTLSAIPQSLLIARKHIHERNKLQYITIAIGIAPILLAQFTPHASIYYLAGASVLASLTGLIIDLILVAKYKILQPIKIQLNLTRQLVNNTYSTYSFNVFLLSLISFFSVQADKLILASVLDIRAVTLYTIITKPYYVLRGFIAVSYPVFQPTITHLNLENNREEYINFTSKFIRVSFMAIASISCLTAVFLGHALLVWLGTTEYNNELGWGILSLGILSLSMLYSPYYRTLVHTHQINKVIYFSLSSVIVNLLLSIFLTSRFGIEGVIIGTGFQILMEYIFTQWQANKYLISPKFDALSLSLLLNTLKISFISFIAWYIIRNFQLSEWQLICTFILLSGGLLINGLYFLKTEGIIKAWKNLPGKSV